jgi:prephenate dehydrogenase
MCARELDVVIYDRTARRRSNSSRSIHHDSLERTASQPVVILAVPVSALKDVVKSIAGFIQKDALVLDVCAVKELPVRWMKSLLPRRVSIIGTHPLFGPDTIGSSLSGHRIVLTPVRVKKQRLGRLVSALRKRGLHVVLMKPAEHDRMIAHTLLVTQFVGRLVGNAKLPHWKNSTRTYEKLRALVEVAERDSEQLLADMCRYNPHAKEVMNTLLRSHLRLQGRLTGSHGSR